MDFSGTQIIAAPLEHVWSYLEDVHKIARCAPGFQRLEDVEPEHWKAVVAVGIGAIKAKFTLDVTRPEMQKPDHMAVKARGKAPGSTVELEGRMQLTALDPIQTRMDWQAHVLVGGTLASIGGRLMNSTAEKLTDQFFSCLQQQLQAENTPTVDAPDQ